jgi:high-affinity iron transporter
MLAPFLIMFREGVEAALIVGIIASYLAAIAVGVGIYQGGIRIDLKRFFKWTGAFIILVAAGLSAGAIRAFHEAGVWDLLQTVVFDASETLPTHSIIGTILSGILGYNDTSTVSEVIAYFGYLIPTMFFFLASNKSKRKNKARYFWG